MDLEDRMIAAEKKYGGMQQKWTRRQQVWKLPFKMAFLWPYWPSTRGPDDVKGPALLVFAQHDYSSDPVFIVSQSGFRTSVAREGTALLSRLAAYFGGIMVPDNRGKEALRMMKEQLYFHLDQSHVIEVFPFADVNDGSTRHGIIRTAMQWERETGNNVWYFPAALQYRNLVPFFKQPFRMPWRLSGWPVPFLTRAKLFVSTNPYSSNEFSPNSGGAKKLVDLLVSEASSLPRYYQEKGLLSAFYTRARQFFLG